MSAQAGRASLPFVFIIISAAVLKTKPLLVVIHGEDMSRWTRELWNSRHVTTWRAKSAILCSSLSAGLTALRGLGPMFRVRGAGLRDALQRRDWTIIHQGAIPVKPCFRRACCASLDETAAWNTAVGLKPAGALDSGLLFFRMDALLQPLQAMSITVPDVEKANGFLSMCFVTQNINYVL